MVPTGLAAPAVPLPGAPALPGLFGSIPGKSGPIPASRSTVESREAPSGDSGAHELGSGSPGRRWEGGLGASILGVSILSAFPSEQATATGAAFTLLPAAVNFLFRERRHRR